MTAFEQSAGQDYWQQDQGNGNAVDNARANCKADEQALLKYIAQLERRVARVKRCPAVESGGYRCERRAGHKGNHEVTVDGK